MNSFHPLVREKTGLSGANSVQCSRDALGIYRGYVKKRKKNENESPRYRLDRENMDVLTKTLSVTVPV